MRLDFGSTVFSRSSGPVKVVQSTTTLHPLCLELHDVGPLQALFGNMISVDGKFCFDLGALTWSLAN
jgi:hypothetical protein